MRPPPAARGELEKDVPYAVSHRVARKEKMALKASVPVRVESMSVHGTTASVNPAARTCTGLFYQGGINRLQNVGGGHPKNRSEFFSWCVNAPNEAQIPVLTVAPATLLARL